MTPLSVDPNEMECMKDLLVTCISYIMDGACTSREFFFTEEEITACDVCMFYHHSGILKLGDREKEGSASNTRAKAKTGTAHFLTLSMAGWC